MTFAKLLHSRLEYAPNPILCGSNYIGNPSASVYEANGYKPVRCTDQPEPQGSGYFMETWTDTGEAIVQGWEWRKATDEDELSDEEALELLLGGGNG